MALVGIEIYPTGGMVHVICKKTNLETTDWCLYPLRDGMGLGRIKFICLSSEKTTFLGGEKIRKATSQDSGLIFNPSLKNCYANKIISKSTKSLTNARKSTRSLAV